MSKIVTFGANQTDRCGSRDVKGIKIYAFLIHGTTNTAFTTGDMLYENMFIKLTLKRGGREHIIFNDNLRNLGTCSNFLNPQWRSAKDFSTGMKTLVAAAVGVNSIVASEMFIDLKGVINLRGTDELIAEYNVASNSVTTSVNTSSSYVNFDWADGIGLEYGTPRFTSYTLQANQQTQDITWGSNVTSAYFQQYDKTSYLTTAQVINTYSLMSDKLKFSNDYLQLINDQQRLFQDETTGALRLQSFQLYDSQANPINNTVDNVDLDDAKIQFNLNTANVNASKNVVGWYWYYADARLVFLARERANTHASRINDKFGLSVGSSAVAQRYGGNLRQTMMSRR